MLCVCRVKNNIMERVNLKVKETQKSLISVRRSSSLIFVKVAGYEN
jgi:hypothetical protein